MWGIIPTFPPRAHLLGQPMINLDLYLERVKETERKQEAESRKQ